MLGGRAVWAGIICTGGQRALKLPWLALASAAPVPSAHSALYHLTSAWLDGPMLPAEEMESMNVHFVLGFLVEMRYGIPRGKLPRNPASTRHNLLMNQIDKGQNVKSLV